MRNAIKHEKWLFDIELSPPVYWGYPYKGTITVTHKQILEYSKVICIAVSKLESKQVYAWWWDEKQNDREVIRNFIELIDDPRKSIELIGHNIERFDIRWLRGRAMFHGIPMQSRYMTTDTLKESRKYTNQESHSLEAIGVKYNVGEKKKTDSYWQNDVCFKNDRKKLAEIVGYCKQDVILNKEVHKLQAPYTETKFSVAERRIDCPECGSYDTIGAGKPMRRKTGNLVKRMQCRNIDCVKTYFYIPYSIWEKYEHFK